MMNTISDYKAQAQIHGVYIHQSTTKHIKLRALLKPGRSNTVGQARHYWGAGWVGNDARIYAEFTSGQRLQTDDFYSLMMHELAHTSHFHTSPLLIGPQRNGVITESWANAVEFYFNQPYYPDRVAFLQDQDKFRIEAGGDDSWKYTPLFIDVIDNTNQEWDNRLSTATDPDGNPLEWADDDVRGYTLGQIQSVLRTRSTLWGVRQGLESYNNSTENHLPNLFNFYRQIEIDNN